MTVSKTKNRSKSHYYQNSERNNNRYFNRDVRIFFKFNNAYQNARQKSRNDRDRSSRVEITTKIEKKRSSKRDDKNFMKDYDKKNKYDRKNRYKDKFREIFKTEEKKNKEKVKTFLTKKKITEKQSDVENYYQSKNIAYFDFDYDEQKKSEISAHITTSLKVQCRQCKASFSFNNRLHQHFRLNKCDQKFRNSFKTMIFANDVLNDIISIIEFKIDVNKNVDFEYDFRN